MHYGIAGSRADHPSRARGLGEGVVVSGREGDIKRGRERRRVIETMSYPDVPSVCEWIEKNYDQLRWVSCSYGQRNGQMTWLTGAGEQSDEEVWKRRFSDTFPDFHFECVGRKANVEGTRWESLKEPKELVLFVWKKETCRCGPEGTAIRGCQGWCSKTPKGILKRSELWRKDFSK
jgi:hypothetical protein